MYAEKEPVDIHLQVSRKQTPSVITKPLHSSQIVLDKNESGIPLQLHIIPNYEFYSTILNARDGIEIIDREEVRNEVAERLSKAFSQYNKD